MQPATSVNVFNNEISVKGEKTKKFHIHVLNGEIIRQTIDENRYQLQ